MLKKFAALGLTAALVFGAPVVAMAQTDTSTPMATPDAGASPDMAAKPMKHKMHKKMMHKKMMHKKMMKKKMDAPAADATPDAK